MRLRWLPLLLVSVCLQAQETLVDLLEAKLRTRIEALDARLNGVMGVAAVDLTTGRTFRYHAETVFAQASLIKVPILVELFRNHKQRLDEKVTLTKQQAVGGSGTLAQELARGPVTLTIRDLATAMIQSSDNTATNVLIAMLGMDRINATIKELGYPQTRLQRIMMDGAAARANRENLSTPAEMAQLMAAIHQQKVVDAQGAAEMRKILELVDADIRKAIPPQIPVASKVGEVPGVHTEAAIVYLDKRPFVVAVMAAYLDGGENPVGATAQLVFEHFRRLAAANQYGNALQ